MMTPESQPSDIYAIADIHGRADLLDVLLGHIADDVKVRGSQPIVVFLGDLIDRGPDSPGVIDRVASTLALYPGSRLILGNHDYYLRELLRGTLEENDAINWLDWGGVATLSAYSNRPIPDLENIADDIRRRFPHHIDVLEGALTYLEIGRFCFVHAGIRPGIELIDQSDHDLRWIRAGFLDHLDMFRHIVLHGHTITASLRPEIYANRVALDTGAYRSGRLTAAVIRNDDLSHFVSTDLDADGTIRVDAWAPEESRIARRV